MGRVNLSGRVIARLAAPFEGGSGPSHSVVDNIWLGEDASAYLPSGGNKADRVRGGLKALRDGRPVGADGPSLPPAPDRLGRVVEELAERLLASGYIKETDVPEVFGQARPAVSAPSPVGSEPASGWLTAAPTPVAAPQEALETAPIFLVHGHDHALLWQAEKALSQAAAREVVILHEQANAGRTLIEKFEDHASAASFAVVLLTPDDVGGTRDGTQSHARARQNVIFELGFFFGRLGRKRVAVLLDPVVEQPSDISGLVYIEADSGGAWKYTLARELQAAGIPVDVSKIR